MKRKEREGKKKKRKEKRQAVNLLKRFITIGKLTLSNKNYRLKNLK